MEDHRDGFIDVAPFPARINLLDTDGRRARIVRYESAGDIPISLFVAAGAVDANEFKYDRGILGRRLADFHLVIGDVVA